MVKPMPDDPKSFDLMDMTRLKLAELNRIYLQAMRDGNSSVVRACVKEFNRRRDAAKK